MLPVQGGRSLLHLCVLHWRTDVVRCLLSLPYLHYNAQDNVRSRPFLFPSVQLNQNMQSPRYDLRG